MLLLVRRADDVVPLARSIVAWSVAASTWGALQFAGLVDEFEGRRPGQREPSFVGIHDFAALSGAALTVGLIGVAFGDGRPAGRRWGWLAIATGGLGIVALRCDDRRRRAVAGGDSPWSPPRPPRESAAHARGSS